MPYTQAIGRRHRVIRRANARAQARFHAAFDAGVITDETARATILYVEAERLIDRLIAPEVPPTPASVVAMSVSDPRRLATQRRYDADEPYKPPLWQDMEGNWHDSITEAHLARAGSFRSDNLADPNESAILADYWNRGQ